MRYEQLINESFKDAKQKFNVQSNNEEIVKEYLETFKDLAKRNIIKGQDKDIGQWIKSGWDDFKAFIDSIKNETSSRQQRHEIKKDAIKLIDTDVMTVIIPLTEKASCYYGKQTKWCTAASESENAFYTYFLNNKTLFYVLIGDRKLAANVDMDNFRINYYDARDNAMRSEDFESITGINEQQLYNWTSKYKDVVNQARKKSLPIIWDRLNKVTINDIKIQNYGFQTERHSLVEYFSIPKIDSNVSALREYFNDNHVDYKKHKEELYNALEHVVDLMKEFTNDSNNIYVPLMGFGIGDDLLALYPPFKDYIKTLVGRHYFYLNNDKVHEINKIDNRKEKEEELYRYKKAISQLLKILQMVRK